MTADDAAKNAQPPVDGLEDQYRLVFEKAHEAIYVIQDGRFVFLNPRTEAFSGYTREELLGRPFAEFLHHDDREAVLDKHRRRLRGEEFPNIYAHRIIDKQGNVRWGEVNAAMIQWKGRPATLIFLTDITEQRDMEEALQRSEEALHSLINATSEALILMDREGRVLVVNETLARRVGKSVDDIIGKPLSTHFTRELNEVREYQFFKAVRTGKTVHYRDTRNGRHFEHHLYPVRDEAGTVARIAVFSSDITKRAQAEQNLRDSEKRLFDIINFLPDATFAIDGDHRVIAWNRAMEEMTGIPARAMQGKGNYEYAIPFYGARRPLLIDLVIEPSEEIEQQYLTFTRADDILLIEAEVTLKGEKRTLWGKAAPFYDSEGNIVGAVQSVRDITDRKRFESSLAQTQKLEAIGTLAGGIAHDFNNILAGIIGYAEITKRKLHQPELLPYMESILQASTRASNMVSQILAFSRKTDLEVKTVNIKALVKEALRLLRGTLPTTIEITSRIESKVKTVVADPTQIHQILMNLCTNAAHAMREKGGGTLDVSLETVEIPSDAVSPGTDLAPGDYVKLTVADTGVGIEPAILDRIFDPYFTTGERGEGTGLGLSVVYGIVKEYGGAVAVESTPGAGASFFVYLPAVEAQGRSEVVSLDPIPRGGERVMFVDDEEALAGIGREMLEMLGYHVVALSSSIEALNAFRSAPAQFDLVMTDMTMPGLTGLDLSREMLQIRSDIPIVLCTGYSELVTEQKAKELGIREFLMKPFSLKDMAGTVRKVLDE